MNNHPLQMNLYKLGLGILLIILSLLWFYYERVYNKSKKNDPIMISFDINIYSGIIVLFITGIILTYNSIFY